MNTFDRLYESLLLNPYNHCALNELWALLRSSDPEEREAAEGVLSDLVAHHFLPARKVS